MDVEVDAASSGAFQFRIVGMGTAATRGMEQRVLSAMRNTGLSAPMGPVTANFAPSDLPKEGPPLDLALAAALLAALAIVPRGAGNRLVVHGELSLDGRVRPAAGALAAAEAALAAGLTTFACASEVAPEAAAVRAVTVFGLRDLRDLVALLNGAPGPRWPPLEALPPPPATPDVDLADVRGQLHARRALEIAAAGGHGLLLVGPPGTGKSMLARRLPGLLPALELGEAIEITRIHSAAGLLLAHAHGAERSRPESGRDDASPCGLVRQRPFRAPHHTISSAGLLGGGRIVAPGEISLAHQGVLFLDELPEFRRDVLESLRQPLDEGVVRIVRVAGRVMLPCQAQIVAAMNPCPCGWHGSGRPCSCGDGQVRKYRGRISGPLLDRLDLHATVPALSYDELASGRAGESSAAVASRVAVARERQLARGGMLNARLSPTRLRTHLRLKPAARRLLAHAVDRMGVSGRAHDRVLQIALTLHDLAGRTEGTPVSLTEDEVAEALGFRMLDRTALPDAPAAPLTFAAGSGDAS